MNDSERANQEHAGRFAKLINSMKERKCEKNIAATKDYVASLQTNQNESIQKAK